MQHLRIAGLLMLVCVTGCPSSRSTESESRPQPASTDAAAPSTTVVEPASTATAEPAAPVAAARPAAPTPKTVASTSASTSGTEEAVAAPNVALAKQTTAPALDLASLKQRLRDTNAIGVFSKLSLKNQIDDLLDEFRAMYRGKVNTPLTTLRQRYDLLIMKVLSLLQDSDQALASDISSSREVIWDILRDPDKFAQIEVG